MLKSKKILLIVISVIVLLFASCGSENDSEKFDVSVSDVIKNVSFDKFDTKLNSVACYNDDIFKNNCEKLYDLEYKSVLDGAMVYSSDSSYANEVSILKDENIEEVRNALQKRAEKRLKTFQGYSPTEAEKIENYRIFEYGGCVCLIISDNTQELEKEIKRIYDFCC